MPRPKKNQEAPVAPPADNAHVEAGAEPFSAPASAFPVYEGVQVTEVLQIGVNNTWNRCKMADGTTRDVPMKLFTSND